MKSCAASCVDMTGVSGREPASERIWGAYRHAPAWGGLQRSARSKRVLRTALLIVACLAMAPVASAQTSATFSGYSFDASATSDASYTFGGEHERFLIMDTHTPPMIQTTDGSFPDLLVGDNWVTGASTPASSAGSSIAMISQIRPHGSGNGFSKQVFSYSAQGESIITPRPFGISEAISGGYFELAFWLPQPETLNVLYAATSEGVHLPGGAFVDGLAVGSNAAVTVAAGPHRLRVNSPLVQSVGAAARETSVSGGATVEMAFSSPLKYSRIGA